MKKTSKFITIVLLSLCFTFFVPVIPSVYAIDTSDISSKLPLEGIYDLTAHKEQTFILQDKNGEIVNITITPLDNLTRIANGSYRVKYQHANYWNGSFTVNISGNKITSASTPSVSAITGSVVRYNLTRASSTQATLSVYWRSILSSVPILTGMKAYISGSTLKVSSL